MKLQLAVVNIEAQEFQFSTRLSEEHLTLDTDRVCTGAQRVATHESQQVCECEQFFSHNGAGGKGQQGYIQQWFHADFKVNH